MQINIISNLEEWREISPEWTKLLSKIDNAHFFQTTSFLITWWEVFQPGELYIITVREDTELVGLAPFFIKKVSGRRKLSFVGGKELSDYLDIIVSPKHENLVLQEIVSHLESIYSHLIDEIYLSSIPNNSATLNVLLNSSLSLLKVQQNVCPQLNLLPNWEMYLSSLNRKQRHEIKRKQRKLESDYNFEFKKISQHDDLAVSIDNFISLHKLSSDKKKNFWTEKRLVFFRKLIQTTNLNSQLELFFLEINGEAVASMLGFNFHHRFYLYNSGFNPNLYPDLSSGTILTAFTIRFAIENNFQIYDFLRGNEEYKYRFGAVDLPVWDIKSAF